MIGVFRFSYLRNKFLFGEHINNTTPLSLGFHYTPSLAAAVGPPSIQISGYTTIGNPTTGPRDTFENAFDESASLSWVHGRHELKFGGGYQRLQVNALQGIATNGFFVFAGFPVVPDAFASFLFGQPVVFLRAWVILSAASGEMQELLCAGHVQGNIAPDLEPGLAL